MLIKAGKQVGDRNFSLYGQEANGGTWSLAVMNMFLHGFDSATIRWGDTLKNPKLKEGDQLMGFEAYCEPLSELTFKGNKLIITTEPQT